MAELRTHNPLPVHHLIFFTAVLLLALSALLLMPVAAQAAYINISDTPTGGDCSAHGSWDNVTKTCTLTGDINLPAAQDGIALYSDGITLDGNGHTLTGVNKLNSGVAVSDRTSVTVKNLKVYEFWTGIDVWNSGGMGIVHITGNWTFSNNTGIYVGASASANVTGNVILSNVTKGLYYWASINGVVHANVSGYNQTGIYMVDSDNNRIEGNTLVWNSIRGMDISSDNTDVTNNNFVNNVTQSTNSGAGNNFWGNHWSDNDTPPDCINTTPFDDYCDSAYTVTPGTTDTMPFVLAGGWNEDYFTWYDNSGGSNWVLMANAANATSDLWMDLVIAGSAKELPVLPGYSMGQVPPGQTITPSFPGLMGGPVSAGSRMANPKPIVSQRMLWPAGGDSLEEIPGTDAYALDDRIWWPWYDMETPGYKDWILVSNPNPFAIHAEIYIGAGLTPAWSGDIAPGSRVTPTFPGVMGGPVQVRGYISGSGDPAKLMASQRILMDGDKTFNELPGLPNRQMQATTNHLWTWYDMTGGASNWILVANPTTASDPIWYEIWIDGIPAEDGGPLAAGASVTPTFPGWIGGPVEVKTFSDIGRTIPAPSIASQRSLWGSSFGEVFGTNRSSLLGTYNWTWYDEYSPGARNWILVANPSSSEKIRATITFTDKISGTVQTEWAEIEPGERWTPTFPGRMGGPVQVTGALYNNLAEARPVITSQRVLWNGYFNEVWGQ